MARRKKEVSSFPAEAPPSDVFPRASMSPEPSQEIPEDLQYIKVSLKGENRAPTNVNLGGLLAYISDSAERTANIADLIWAVTGLLVIVVAVISILVILCSHDVVLGYIGLASSSVAGIMRISSWIRVYIKRRSSRR